MIRSRLSSFILATLFGAAAWLTSAAAHADMCATDQRPGASLLIPYFEVDLAGTPGRPATRAFGCATPAASAPHQRPLWTTWGVPALHSMSSFRLTARSASTRRDLPAGQAAQTGPASRRSAFDSVGTAVDVCDVQRGTHAGPAADLYALGGRPSRTASAIHGTVTSNAIGYAANLVDTWRAASSPWTTSTRCSSGLSPTDAGYFVSGGFCAATNDNVCWAASVRPSGNNSPMRCRVP